MIPYDCWLSRRELCGCAERTGDRRWEMQDWDSNEKAQIAILPTSKSTQKPIIERKFMFALKKKYCVLGSILFLTSIPFLAKAVRTDVSRDFPVYNNHGKPDLTVDPKRFANQMEIVDRLFDASSCEISEGSVGGTGYRRLLRFDTVLINGGDGDLVLGSPTHPNNTYHSAFIDSPC